MKCPACGAPKHEIRVMSTDHTDTHIRRRRSCGVCEQKFSTVEVVIADSQRVPKFDGPFVDTGEIAKVLTPATA